ncbi:hypothetical protein IFM89_023301 [Coptis chinensis]|uniref:FBD domain-containing protein n=1 Tax=Coptis chinensis TaxID=261450 RepID=A0A835H068_9MAGN|nr:hypothetical protein IFM89_023301 [Coptis chinensis]
MPPISLQELNLRCYHGETRPIQRNPSSLPELLYLYIENGELTSSDFSGQHTLLGNGRFWESIPHEEIIFARLKNLVLSGFMGMKNEVSFVQFILRCAGMLHTIRITWDTIVEKGTKRTGTLENMMQFRRASPIARVIFSG